MISQAMDMVGPDDDGWTRLSEVGTALRRIDPGFDPRSYGYRQLSQLIKAHGQEFEMRKVAGGAIIEIRLRVKDFYDTRCSECCTLLFKLQITGLEKDALWIRT